MACRDKSNPSLIATECRDGRQGGLFAAGQVDAQAQQLMLDSVTEFVPDKEASACLGPQGDGMITLACLEEAMQAGGARWQGAWQ